MTQNITDVDTFTDPIVIPSDGETANAASLLLGMQGLANRTLRLMSILSGSQDVVTPVSRTIRLGASFFQAGDHNSDTQTVIRRFAAGMGAFGTATTVLTSTRTGIQYVPITGSSTKFVFDLSGKIPAGSIITEVRAMVDQTISQGTTTDCVRFTLQSWEPDYTAGPPAVAGTVTAHADVRYPTSTTGIRNVEVTGLSVTVDPNKVLSLQVSESIGAADRVYQFEVQYTGPDPVSSQQSFSTAAGTGSRVLLRNRNGGSTGRTRATLELNRLVPEGATINTVRVLVKPGAARSAAERVDAALYANTTRSFTTPAAGTPVAQDGPTNDDGTANVQSIVLSPAYLMTTDPVVLDVLGGYGDFLSDILYGAEVVFTDPGARNF